MPLYHDYLYNVTIFQVNINKYILFTPINDPITNKKKVEK